jgi:multiple sugar transport system permease protein
MGGGRLPRGRRPSPDPMTSDVVSTAVRPAPRGRAWRRESLFGYLGLVPAIAVLAFVVAWPLYEAVRMSLFEIYLLTGFFQETFVGVQNYVRFARDPNAPTYLLNTLIYVVGGTAGQFVVALTLALLLGRRIRFAAFWRGLAIIPWAMPITVTAMVWKWILNGQWGILNYVLVQLGILDEYVSWLSSPVWLWPSIILVNVWAGFPFMFINLLSGVQGIPRELYDAGRIDGGGAGALFWRITLPLLRPVIAALVLLSVIIHLREFATLWVLTSGGPGIRSTTLSPLVYVTSFRFFRLGYGAALGVILMSVSLIFTVLYLRRVRFEA